MKKKNMNWNEQISAKYLKDGGIRCISYNEEIRTAHLRDCYSETY